MKKIFERLDRIVQTYNAYCHVEFDYGDDSTDGMITDEVCITTGDSNCPHPHRADARTGHGFTHITEQWKAGDKGMASLERALDRFEKEMNSPYKCKKCEKILVKVI